MHVTHLCHRVHTHTRPIDLDLVCVHGCVCNQDLCVLNALRLPHADLLVEDVALVQVGLLQVDENV